MRHQQREVRGLIERRWTALPPHPLKSAASGDPEGLQRWRSTESIKAFLSNINTLHIDNQYTTPTECVCVSLNAPLWPARSRSQTPPHPWWCTSQQHRWTESKTQHVIIQFHLQFSDHEPDHTETRNTHNLPDTCWWGDPELPVVQSLHVWVQSQQLEPAQSNTSKHMKYNHLK